MLPKYDDDPNIDAAVREYHEGLTHFKRQRLFGEVSHHTKFQGGNATHLHGVLDKHTNLTAKRAAG